MLSSRWMLILCAAALVVLMMTARAVAYVNVFGGPTYTPGIGGFNGGRVTGVNDAGTAIGNATKYDADDADLGVRAFRWDASGAAASELGNLGTNFDGVANSYANAINDAGTVVGNVEKYGGLGESLGYLAVRWEASGTAATELGNLGTDSDGFTYSDAYAINNEGTAVGIANMYDGSGEWFGVRAVRWEGSGTAATELGNLGTDIDGVTYSYPNGINDAGIVVGDSEKYDGSGESLGGRAVRWEALGTAATELGNLSADALGSTSTAINSAGVTVGADYHGDFPDERVIRWDASGAATELEIGNEAPFELGYPWREPVVINDAGIVVGRVHGDFYTISVRWDASGIPTELLDLGMRGGAWVEDINNAGIAVGTGGEPGMFSYVYSAVYWGLDGVAIDLNTLIDPASGWTLKNANAISDTGWIAGSGMFDPDGPGGQEAYSRLFLLQLQALAGDFNGDGVVDAADYTVWRDHLGATDESALNGNGDGLNGVDAGDYALWKSNYGATLGSSSGNSIAVPELSTCSLFGIAFLGLAAFKRTRPEKGRVILCSARTGPVRPSHNPKPSPAWSLPQRLICAPEDSHFITSQTSMGESP